MEEGVVLINAAHCAEKDRLKNFLDANPNKLVFGITYSQSLVEEAGLFELFGNQVRCLGYSNAQKREIVRKWLGQDKHKDLAADVTEVMLTRLIENEEWREEPGVTDILFALEDLKNEENVQERFSELYPEEEAAALKMSKS